MKFIKEICLRLWHSPTYTTWGNFIVSASSLLVTMPLLLRKFNPDVTAVWFLFTTIITFVHIADLGFTPTFTRLTAFVMGGATDLRDFRDIRNKGDGKVKWDVMEKLYGNIGYVYIISTLLVFVCAITFGTLILSKPISKVHNQPEMWQAWSVTIIGLSINFYGKKYEALLQGMNYIALVNRINIIFGFLGVIVSFIILLNNGTILQLAIATQVFSILISVRGWLILRQVENGRFRKFKLFSFNKEIFEAAWAPSWRSAIVILGSTGVTQASGFMFAQVGDLKILASYLFALKLMNTISDISKAPFYTKTPVFSKLRSEGKLFELTEQTSRAIFISLTIFFIGAICVLFCPYFLRLVSSKVVFINPKLWILMVVVWALERHHAMHAQIYSTTNHVPFYVPIIISGIVNLLLAMLLLPKIGIWAFPIAQGVSNALMNNWWNVKISLKSLNQTFSSYYKIMFVQFKIKKSA